MTPAPPPEGALRLDGTTLTIEDAARAADPGVPVAIDEAAVRRMAASRALVDRWVDEGRVMYGVTTGFGEFSNVVIPRAALEQLQRNLIVSHAVGCGDPIPRGITRILMLLRANALAKGHSGIRPATVRLLVDMLNADIVPVVPSQGSVGSSGDLVQLAHLVLAMIGEGVCWNGGGGAHGGAGDPVPAREALRAAGLEPATLAAKEGLALINGTQMMCAYLTAVLSGAFRLQRICDIAGAMTLEALLGTDRATLPQLHALRPHRGQQESARNLRRIIAGSALRESHRHGHDVVQDAYSLRCMPQVHGASRDALRFCAETLTVEINAATDNPLIFPQTDELIEGGNFHGQPVAIAADLAAIALAELASISERRTERMVNGKLSGLPRFLTEQGGLHSGMMIAQYTAASLVSENKVLAHPASVDSIPTSANQEDHNSMGSIAARKAWSVLRNAEQVLAIELLTAAQALDFRAPLAGGRGTAAAHRRIRAAVPHLAEDRFLHDDLQAVLEMIRTGAILRETESEIGPLE